MDKSVTKVLEDIEKAIRDSAERRQQIEALLLEFPDLRISTDRWQRQRYTSKKVNGIADRVDFRHNCGCCNDSPLEARPYVETLGVQVFSDPDCFRVGEKYLGLYDFASPGWCGELEAHGISKTAIEKVGRYLDAHSPPDAPDWKED